MDQVLATFTQWWSGLADYFAFDTSLLADRGMIWRFVLQVALLLCSAFFSGSETALFSLSGLDLQRLRRQRHRNSDTLHALLDQPRRLIISILCGNEMVNIAAVVNLTSIMVTLYGPGKAGVISVIVMLPLILLFGEVTPKTIAVSNPARISANLIATPLNLWVRLIAPVRWLIRGVADRVTTWLVGERTDAENILRVDEFRTLVEEVAREGALNATERVLIHNLLDASDTEVVEIMTPRTRMFFINESTPVPEAIERFRAGRHSRVPVFSGHRDNLVGFIHAEDIVRIVLDGMDLRLLSMDDLVHPPVVVPPTKEVDEMFDYFQNNNCRAAVVLDEFGGVAGFVTIADVLNFIFGQIAGRVPGEELYSETDQEAYEVPGDMKLADFEKLTNFGIEDTRMTTVGGVAFRHLDRLPKVGDTVCVDDIRIVVLKMDDHRIAKVRVERIREADSLPAPPDEADADDAEPDVTDAPPSVVQAATEERCRSGEMEDGRATDSDSAAEHPAAPSDRPRT